MTEYLLELYVSRPDASAIDLGDERARRAADELTKEGTAVRYVRSIFVPEDETWFVLCEAASSEAIRELARRARLPLERVTEARSVLGTGRQKV